ncbi:hypothetical protein ACROYT_G043282 [Oculina patagonica]
MKLRRAEGKHPRDCFCFFNVLGDSIGAGVVEHLPRDDLRKYDCNGIVDDRALLSNLEKQEEPKQVVVTSAL